MYRDLRAAAESGWDFSTRWLAEDGDGQPSTQLHTICTTRILPVDLNCFLHALEMEIARLARATGDVATADDFDARAHRRCEAIRSVFWDEAAGCFVDHDLQLGRRRRALTAATVVPLYLRVATEAQAVRVADTVRARLLAPGGLGTSEQASGQQWDRPNGWAPLQWMAAEGFAHYGHHALAREIRARWLATVQSLYEREGKLVEKYALRASLAHPAEGGGGGEYPLQDGFGWTNGVTRRWLHGQAPR